MKINDDLEQQLRKVGEEKRRRRRLAGAGVRCAWDWWGGKEGVRKRVST
jgi:hypothetical protein